MTIAGTVLRAPFAARTWRELAYSWATIVPAIPAFALLLASLVAGALSLVAIGLPLLMGCLVMARHGTSLFRRPARGLLGWPWPPPTSRAGSALRDREAWGSLAFCAVKFPITVVACFAGTVVLFTAAVGLTSPLWWPFSHSVFGLYDSLTWPQTWLLALQAALVLLALPWLVRLLVAIEKTIALSLVAPRDEQRRIAGLEASRRALTEDATATLKRIERDLHDGTQARLVSLGMLLGRLDTRLDGRVDPATRELAATASRIVAETVEDLREIIRGVHPPALDDGLSTAVATLASRSAVPAELVDELPGRVTGPASTMLYFATAELLTNVARHACATRATVRLTETASTLRLTVTDDGHGGASPATDGTGLAGLRRRVQALDGNLDISSPPGGPTVITVDVARD